MSNMTDNLYEMNNLTTGSNSLTVTRSGYAIHSTTSLQPSPVSPHINHKYMPSPTTPQNELSPLLDIPHDEGSWEHNQLEKSASLLTETMNSHVAYSFNGSEALHRLDSFSKAFPGKKANTVFSNSVGEKNSEDNQVSEIMLSPQRGTPSAGSDREVFNTVTLQTRSQECHNQLMHNPINNQNMDHISYQSNQQYYGYQHHKPQLRENNSVPVYKLPYYKSQGQYLLQQQGNQIHQHQQLTPYSLAQQKQQIPPVQEGHESVGSPTDSYTEDYKGSEQIVYQTNLHTSHFQGSQNFLSLSHQSDLYQQQQTNELSHSFPFKQNPFEDHLGSVDSMAGYSSPKEEIYMDLNYHHKQEDFYSSHYQSVGSGVNQTAQSPVLKGGVLHLNSYRPPCGQMPPSDIQEDQFLPYYRMEAVRAEGAKTKLKCILCHREFKSLPALNGHMRSHGGFRTHPSTLKSVSLQTDEPIQLSKEVIPIDPMVFPVSVPVKDYSVPSRLPNKLESHLRHDLNDLDESHPQQQKVLPSRGKSLVGTGESAAKQEKKRYRHCLVPLVISPCGADLESRGPVLFQSQLRSPSSCGDVPYTPPPMLSPVRPGSGLFNSVNVGHPCSGIQTVPRVRLCIDSIAGDKHDCSATLGSEDKSSSIKPRINIGCDFQADIPDIQSHSKVAEDIHKANLLWTPCYLNTPEKQQRVDDLLKMACSSVLPGGGTNTEYTLHCLFECNGDVMTTLEKLLSLTALTHTSSLHTNYHYAGSDKWTLQEKRQLNKALLTHNKDFYLIQKMVKTKTVAQCVEYYYTWKEKLRLGRRFSTGPITPGQVKENRGNLKEGNTRRPTHKTKSKTVALDFSELSDISGAFVCEVPRSGPMFNGNEWNQSTISGLCNSPAEYNRPKSAQHFTSSSVKSSPSNSSTSGDTDSHLIFPCIECGKVFLKVKSRNAHMKTHRQPDDPQFWQLRSLPEQEDKMVTPASPTVGLLQLPLTHSASCSNNGDIKSLYINNSETLQQADCLLQNLKE